MRRLTITCLTAASLALPAAASADTGDVIVRYRSGTDAAERSDVRRDADVTREVALPVSATELVDPEPGVTTSDALAALRADEDVLYAEPDVSRRALLAPSDPLFSSQWGLQNTGQQVGGAAGTPDADIDATDAWDVVTGSSAVTVAVIDTGIDALHPDLAPNIVVNPGERLGNGVDDDGNGFVDDVSGWDFADDDAGPEDNDGHGSHVAGTAAASGNDARGVTGVAWDAALLPVRVIGADGFASVSDLIRAYGYAAARGARVVNLSLGGSSESRAERDAIAAHPNVLFVTAAGNDSADNDQRPTYPCNHDLANVVCVAASDRSDRLAGFSNRGAATVDLAAPGVAIVSTYRGGYARLSGTSMATPHVSGAAALLLARAPASRVVDLRAALLSSVDASLDLAGRTVTGGRLNVAAALARLQVSSQPTTQTTTGSEVADDAPPPDPGPAPALAPSTSPAPTPSLVALPQPPPPDRGPPTLSLSFSPRHDLSAILRRGLRVAVRCSERCALRLTLRRGRTTIARGSATRTRAGTATVTLRLSARQRARLSRLRSTRLELRTQATDPAGNGRTVVRRLTLRR